MPHKRASTHKRLASRQGASDKAPDAKVMRGHLSDVPKSALRILQAGKVREDFRSKMHLPGMRRSAEDVGPKAKREALKQQQKLKGEGHEKASSASTSNLTLREGEKLGDFNRRVEMAMAPRLPSKSSRKRRKLAAEKQAALDAGAPHVCKDPSRCLVHQQLAHKARLAREENEGSQSKSEKRFAKREPGKADLARARASLEKASAGKGGALARSNNVSDEEEELDFAPRPQGRRLNDVAQAPPTLTRAPRGHGEAAKARKRKLAEALGASVPEVDARHVRLPDPVVGKSRSGVNVRREEELEKERERAIKEYRRMKFGREERGM
ncbi:hypothetical protein IE81DRAFT_90774 [Ceraceosorus guamensis]|uniref:Uncharacterized protein n=1 Tax=Ceraceosorus guamensis TaxID=1522189 RepID=A0A316W0V6_9BASI|nr:hypothetical protein IE81DRAFT_90774 [Ceraceosorus guamensis]PWN43430.1 hypothetical protein IE81DRAFT_90774 [Ceraceosorus guamensis]